MNKFYYNINEVFKMAKKKKKKKVKLSQAIIGFTLLTGAILYCLSMVLAYV